MTIKVLKAMGNVIVINLQSLTLAIICTRSVAYLVPSEISMMEQFLRKYLAAFSVNHVCKTAPS